MSQAERMQYYGLPDAQKKEYLQNIERAGAAQVSALSDRKAGIAAASTVAQQQRDSYMGLLSADTQQRLGNIQRLMDVRSNYAQYEDKEFMLNQLEPFQQEMAAAQQFQAAGMQNIFGALKGATQLKMEGIDLFDKQFAGPRPEGVEPLATPETKRMTPEVETPGLMMGAQPTLPMPSNINTEGVGFDVNLPNIFSTFIPRRPRVFNPNEMSFPNRNPMMGTFNYGG